MPLAPKVGAPSERTRGSTNRGAGQKAKRERTKAARDPNTTKPYQRYPCLDWETVEDEVVWAADVAGKITQSQLGSNGFYSFTVYVPESYAHSVLDAALAQKNCMAYIRLYTVPLQPFIDAMEAEAGEEDGDN